jgi:hypothetical protein
MRKYFVLIFVLALLSSRTLFAEEGAVAETPSVPTEAVAEPVADPAVEPTPAVEPEAVPAPEAPAAPVADAVAATPAVEPAVTDIVAENLEFVSGEVTSIDETAKTVTLKLYGDTEDAANDKVLTVSLDDNTDVTDGEKDRDLKSLTAGTEVDVEYDAKSNKATYIFVY